MTTFQVPQRMNFTAVAPKVFKAVLALDAAAREGIDPVLLELVQIRASQINRCAYCIGYHSTDARKAGETEERVHQLSAWEESSLYTVKERAALAMTEAVTRLPDGVPDEVYDEAARHFDERELAQLIALIFTVNTWNRMNVTTRKTPGTV
ncbi:carboxymuconolactone decarboxylase family protein [Streptomyces ipomoeae]|nr:carboxymuconolactone decarboxylase family protein [Streptomyces ipomoeae]MDX2692009.1 carboxymuconolactone decarboxylase family protein [Streptomyces ipomoeae]MDX2823113.1 carboxymuconolactone decarboxylase family protein [Streptomyces ipomoeae]MDX2840587.1 carboxymuconolactone decarboxylase family protein [Streptomyces ipomoeae]MDX2874834.1 carboxymuconolactone decarboxylase family protein [Streptomyces ipomoeae]